MPRFAAQSGQVAREVIGGLEDLDRGTSRALRSLEQRRQVRDVVRAEDDIDVRQVRQHRLAVPLSDATTHGDEDIGIPALGRLE